MFNILNEIRYLNNNQLSGRIPDTIGQLEHLSEL